jgi:hypothetical protein
LHAGELDSETFMYGDALVLLPTADGAVAEWLTTQQ